MDQFRLCIESTRPARRVIESDLKTFKNIFMLIRGIPACPTIALWNSKQKSTITTFVLVSIRSMHSKHSRNSESVSSVSEKTQLYFTTIDSWLSLFSQIWDDMLSFFCIFCRHVYLWLWLAFDAKTITIPITYRIPRH